MTATKYFRGVDWEGAKAKLAEPKAAPSGHPIHADDDVGRIAGELSDWALAWATDVMVASRKSRTRAERSDALTRAFDAWPKICRRMTELEKVAPNAAIEGAGLDADMQEIVAVVQRKAQSQ